MFQEYSILFVGSETSNMEVDNNNSEQPTNSDIQLESEQHDTTGETENTHICDNNNPSDDSSCHGHSNNYEPHDPSNHSDSSQGNSPQSDTTPIGNSENSNTVPSETSNDSNRESGQLEPVISLHYSTEGTTSSTIRLGFARFENLEAGILQRSAEDASLSDLVPENVGNQDNVLESHNSSGSSELHDSIEDVDSSSIQSQGVTRESDSCLNQSEADGNDIEPLDELSKTCQDLTDTQESAKKHPLSSPEGQSSSGECSSSDQGQSSSNTLQFEFSEMHSNPPVMDKVKGQSSSNSQALADSKNQSSPQDKTNARNDGQSSTSDQPVVDEGQSSSNSPATHMSHLHIRPG